MKNFVFLVPQQLYAYLFFYSLQDQQITTWDPQIVNSVKLSLLCITMFELES